jgi:hypothetical protein
MRDSEKKLRAHRWLEVISNYLIQLENMYGIKAWVELGLARGREFGLAG